MWGIIGDAFEYSAKNTTSIDSKLSLYDFFRDRVQHSFPGDNCEEERRIVLQLAKSWGAFVGSPVETQSLKFFWLEECIEGGEVLISFWHTIPLLSLEATLLELILGCLMHT